jgi:hypothetical protein
MEIKELSCRTLKEFEEELPLNLEMTGISWFFLFLMSLARSRMGLSAFF